jgi:hypothetical protein
MSRWLRRGWYLLVVLFLACSLAMLIQGRVIGHRIAGFHAHIAGLDARIAALPPVTYRQRVRFEDLASRPWPSLTPAEKAGTNQYLKRSSLEHERDVYWGEVSKARRERSASQGWLVLDVLLILLATLFLLGRMLWRRVRIRRHG